MRQWIALSALVLAAGVAVQVIAPDASASRGGRAAETFSGIPRVIDGDGLEVAGISLRLHGIDAPEMGQMCTRDGQQIDCGALARDGLVALIGDHPVSCRQEDYDSRYNRPVVACDVLGENLNEQLVASGYATAYRRYSTRYVAAETMAQSAGRGIWATDMIAPEAWRHSDPVVALRPASRVDRAAVEPDTAAACVIKGNISSNGQIYHMPGQDYYNDTRISAARGERWFCSEAEAVAAGWRRARR